MKILVAIAYYGTVNEKPLQKLIKTYHDMPYDISIVILSNVLRDFGPDLEVIVGTPSTHPHSLPFAYYPLFRDRLESFDYFIYSEDDTLVSITAIDAFIQASKLLPENEIAGFMRTEEDSTGELFYSGCHSFFRWIPGSVRERGGKLWAEHSNQHSACFIATQKQIKQGFTSKGLQAEPHQGRFSMRCSAATNIYVASGLTRIVCIDSIPAFTLPHLSNKYIGRMGISENELQWQIDALRSIFAGELCPKELLQPETKLPGARGSKCYHAKPDSKIEDMIKSESADILVWAAGDGVFEKSLQNAGHNVSVVPLDSVMATSCLRRGLKLHNDNSPKYDTVLLIDVLHLVANPQTLLDKATQLIKPSGELIVRVPNFRNYKMLYQRCTNKLFTGPWTRERIGATPFRNRELQALAKKSNLLNIEIETVVQRKFNILNWLTLGLISSFFSSQLYLRASVRKTSIFSVESTSYNYS